MRNGSEKKLLREAGEAAREKTFDARVAKVLQPGEYLTIAHCPGLQLRANGLRKTWTYRYRSPLDSRMRQARLGLWPAMSLTRAIGEWAKLKQARDDGVDASLARRELRRQHSIPKAVAEPAKGITVNDLVQAYRDRRLAPRRKARGVKEVGRMFDTMLDTIAGQPAASLTRAQAYELLERHQSTPVQAAKLRAELRAAWSFALDSGLLPAATPNWWGDVMRGQLRSFGKRIEGQPIGPVKRSLSALETGRLIRWLPNFPRVVHDVLILYLWTLARGSEICSMEAGEISLEPDGLWWTVPRHKTKNARHPQAMDFRVPLVGRARAIVQRRLELRPNGFLFPSPGESGHIEQKMIQTSVFYHQPYSRTRPEHQRPRLTVTRWAPHDLRRTSRTLLAALECPEEIAEAMLGHMQTVYNRHKYDPRQREWIGVLDAYLETLAGSNNPSA